MLLIGSIAFILSNRLFVLDIKFILKNIIKINHIDNITGVINKILSAIEPVNIINLNF
jgi:hypothetical protein